MKIFSWQSLLIASLGFAASIFPVFQASAQCGWFDPTCRPDKWNRPPITIRKNEGAKVGCPECTPQQPRPAQAEVPCRNAYSQDFSWRKLNRTGRVVINNQRNSPVQITLIHPDSASKLSDWTIAASNQTFLAYNNQTFYVGDDWGIQIGGGCVYYIGEVGIYNSQAYEITLSDPGRISLSGLKSPY